MQEKYHGRPRLDESGRRCWQWTLSTGPTRCLHCRKRISTFYTLLSHYDRTFEMWRSGHSVDACSIECIAALQIWLDEQDLTTTPRR